MTADFGVHECTATENEHQFRWHFWRKVTNTIIQRKLVVCRLYRQWQKLKIGIFVNETKKQRQIHRSDENDDDKLNIFQQGDENY